MLYRGDCQLSGVLRRCTVASATGRTDRESSQILNVVKILLLTTFFYYMKSSIICNPISIINNGRGLICSHLKMTVSEAFTN